MVCHDLGRSMKYYVREDHPLLSNDVRYEPTIERLMLFRQNREVHLLKDCSFDAFEAEQVVRRQMFDEEEIADMMDLIEPNMLH